MENQLSSGDIFFRTDLVRGQPVKVRSIEIGGQYFDVTGRALRVVRLADEWYEDVDAPEAIVQVLRSRKELSADLFTFWQRPPHSEPKYSYAHENDEIAVLPVSNFEHWWQQDIKPRIRTAIRKSWKQGLEVRETQFDDAFVQGMTSIFNESPIRQGRKFWHYGKDHATVETQFSRFLYREHLIGAYYEGRMIGFIMLGSAGRFALLGQILSSLHHRDKSTTYALIAKAVEVCQQYGFEYLVYWYWSDDSLSEFKRRCGFRKITMPRYYVPLSVKGSIALKLGLHRGLAHAIPDNLKRNLKQLRRSINAWRS